MSLSIVHIPSEPKGPERIRHIMKEKRLLQKDVARSIGISEAQLSLMLREERSTTSNVALQLTNRYGRLVADFIWDIGLKSTPKGLVTGNPLQKLCEEGGVLSGCDPSNILQSYVAVRMARLVSLIHSDRPEDIGNKEIDIQPLALRFGQTVRVSIVEELRLPSDTRADVYLSQAKIGEGFAPENLMMRPASPSFPPIIFQYWGDSPAYLSKGDSFFDVSFYKI